MRGWNDERLDTLVGLVLRTGVTLAAAIVLIGGVWFLAIHNNPTPDYHKFHSAPYALTHLSGIARAAVGLNPLDIVQFGILVLIATPMLRVLVCVAGFGAERDWTYAIISSIVLAFLVYSIVGSGI